MNSATFYETYCKKCGSQRCPGIEDADWGSGCAHYDEWDDSVVTDDNGVEVSPLDDDYLFWKSEQERLTNPLSDDYCKYDNE